MGSFLVRFSFLIRILASLVALFILALIDIKTGHAYNNIVLGLGGALIGTYWGFRASIHIIAAAKYAALHPLPPKVRR